MANVFDLVEDADILIGVFFFISSWLLLNFAQKGVKKRVKQMLANALSEIISNFSRIIDFLAQSRKDEATCRRSFFLRKNQLAENMYV